jgi:hypothetical protein
MKKYHIHHTALFANFGVLVFLSSCELQAPGGVSNYSFAPTPIIVEVAKQNASDDYLIPSINASKVDLLFVVDNSGSMAGEQQILANSFNNFIQQFTTRNIDFHVGVVTTDVTSDSNTAYWAGPSYSGYLQANRGNLLSKFSERYLTNTSLDLVNKFITNVKVGTSGSGAEQGIQSALAALDNNRIGVGQFNEGFLRDDSLLAVIIVSDEDEYVTPTQQQLRIQALADRLSELRPAQSKGSRVEFVINKSAAIQSYSSPQSTMYYPDTYLKAAQLFNSTPIDITSEFSGALVNIGSDIAQQAQSEYRLSAIPLQDSLIVTLNDVKIPMDAVDGYTYRVDRNSIELHGLALTSSPGGHLVIQYIK